MESRIPENLLSILTRHIPPERRLHKDCIAACQSVLDELATPEDIEAVCFHEAGHFIFAVLAGLDLGFAEEQIQMQAPWVRFKDGVFIPIPGSTDIPPMDEPKEWTTTLVTHYARVAMAGGVFAGRFANRPEKGTAGDVQTFEDYYRQACWELFANANFLTASKYQAQAKEFISDLLETDPTLGDLAKEKAKEYKLEHFIPFVDYAKDTKRS